MSDGQWHTVASCALDTRTDRHGDEQAPREKAPELIDKPVRGVPLRRIGTPQVIAHALVYLASDESVYVTGSELVVGGGTTA